MRNLLLSRCGLGEYLTSVGRIEHLQEYDLLAEQLNLDQDGHHYKTYMARLERIDIELTEGTFEIEVTYRPEDAADRFTDLFEGLR